MKKSLTITREQQVEFADKVSVEMDKVIIPWNKDMKRWYPVALQALRFTSIKRLKIAPENYSRLYFASDEGVNMNIVMFLVNNLEDVTPSQMQLKQNDFIQLIALNQNVSAHWNTFHKPIYEKVYREYELMANNPGIIKPFTAEA